MKLLINTALHRDVTATLDDDAKEALQEMSDTLDKFVVLHEVKVTDFGFSFKVWEQKCTLEEEDATQVLSALSSLWNIRLDILSWDSGMIRAKVVSTGETPLIFD